MLKSSKAATLYSRAFRVTLHVSSPSCPVQISIESLILLALPSILYCRFPTYTVDNLCDVILPTYKSISFLYCQHFLKILFIYSKGTYFFYVVSYCVKQICFIYDVHSCYFHNFFIQILLLCRLHFFSNIFVMYYIGFVVSTSCRVFYRQSILFILVYFFCDNHLC